jgi:hypothetical protein
MKPIDWDIRRKGRLWSHEEFDERISQAPEKIEFVDGIFASDRQMTGRRRSPTWRTSKAP